MIFIHQKQGEFITVDKNNLDKDTTAVIVMQMVDVNMHTNLKIKKNKL